MAIELERAVQVGGRRVAALVRRSAASRGGGGLSAWIAKQPLAILIAAGAETWAFDLSGNPVALDEVERLCPGAVSRFRRGAE